MLRDKFAGCLIGLAVGDALCVPRELFSTFYFREINCITKIISCLLQTIIQNNGYNTNKTILAYEELATTHKYILDNNFYYLFKGLTTVRGFRKRWNKQFKDKDESVWNQSCGSLIRTTILSFLNEEDIITDCKLT